MSLHSIEASPIEAVFFDLDGTLVDTAPDLYLCLAEALNTFGLQCPGLETIRHQVSHGTQAMLKAASGFAQEDPAFLELERCFLERYQANICRHSRLFPGMEQVLGHLQQQKIPWGIITNKPAFLTQPLCLAMGLVAQAACILSGDSLPWCKPHPAPILHACQTAGTAPAKSLYIGDARRDIEAGRAAGCPTLIASYGYIGPEDKPTDWHANGIILEPLEILAWLKNQG